MTSSKSCQLLLVLGLCVSHGVSVHMKQPKCRGKDLKMNEKDLKGIEDCMKELVPNVKVEEGGDMSKATKGIPKEKMACLGKCILTNEGLLDDKGKPGKDNMMEKLNSTMPEEVIEELDTAIVKCIEDHGKMVDPEDKTCQTYQPLTQCMTVSFLQVCKEKKET